MIILVGADLSVDKDTVAKGCDVTIIEARGRLGG